MRNSKHTKHTHNYKHEENALELYNTQKHELTYTKHTG